MTQPPAVRPPDPTRRSMTRPTAAGERGHAVVFQRRDTQRDLGELAALRQRTDRRHRADLLPPLVMGACTDRIRAGRVRRLDGPADQSVRCGVPHDRIHVADDPAAPSPTLFNPPATASWETACTTVS